jgi:hypothetical protein
MASSRSRVMLGKGLAVLSDYIESKGLLDDREERVEKLCVCSKFDYFSLASLRF